MYDIKPKETEYNGIKFRSRLEARYACFFDLLGWKYAYEPDLNFKDWQPDFVIYTQHEYNIAVEVKPSYLHNKELTLRIINATDHTHHILLLHEAPQLNDNYHFVLGDLWKLASSDNDEIIDCYDYDVCAVKKDKGVYGLSHYNLDWRDIVNKVWYKSFTDIRDITKLWNEAGNIVQFKTY